MKWEAKTSSKSEKAGSRAKILRTEERIVNMPCTEIDVKGWVNSPKGPNDLKQHKCAVVLVATVTVFFHYNRRGRNWQCGYGEETKKLEKV